MTSSWRRTDVTTSHRFQNDVISTWRARWDFLIHEWFSSYLTDARADLRIHCLHQPLCALSHGERVQAIIMGNFHTKLDYTRAGPAILAVGTDQGCFDILFFVYHFILLSPSICEIGQMLTERLKYCIREPLNSKQPASQPFPWYYVNSAAVAAIFDSLCSRL